MLTEASKNPVKMISRATDFAFRKRQNAAMNGKVGALGSFGRVIAIARLLAELSDGKDQYVVAAGYLFDITRDTDCTILEIEQRFGREVGRIIQELQIEGAANKDHRRQMELALAGGRSQRAKMIVMADHTQAVHTLPAPQATIDAIEKRLERLTWSCRIVKACRGAHKPLGEAFDRAYANALDKANNALAGISGADADALRSQIGDAYRSITA